MASWKDKIVPAKFNGVSFFVDTSERTGGRRAQRHDYPFKDEPFFEDMGMKARAFPVDGYVIGADYITARDALITQLEKAGPGELIHPYYGVKHVIVGDYRVRESTNEGGIARFSIEFLETPTKPAQPTGLQDPTSKVRASADTMTASVGQEFFAKYSPGTLLGSAQNMIRAATLTVNNALGAFDMTKQAVASMKRRLEILETNAVALSNAPEDLFLGISEMFANVGTDRNSTAFTKRSMTAVLSLYDFPPGDRPPGTTPNRIQEQTNYDALQQMMQRLVVTQAARLLLEQVFSTFEEALAARNRIADLLDEQAEAAADDVYPDMLQLRGDLVLAVPNEDLAHIAKYTPKFSVPSLVLAQRLYGDLDSELDLVKRNRVRNPMFLKPNVELEVLSRG